jgi:hypothetical protein
MFIYAGFAFFAVFCLWGMPIETTGRPMLATMDELVRPPAPSRPWAPGADLGRR